MNGWFDLGVFFVENEVWTVEFRCLDMCEVVNKGGYKQKKYLEFGMVEDSVAPMGQTCITFERSQPKTSLDITDSFANCPGIHAGPGFQGRIMLSSKKEL